MAGYWLKTYFLCMKRYGLIALIPGRNCPSSLPWGCQTLPGSALSTITIVHEYDAVSHIGQVHLMCYYYHQSCAARLFITFSTPPVNRVRAEVGSSKHRMSGSRAKARRLPAAAVRPISCGVTVRFVR